MKNTTREEEKKTDKLISQQEGNEMKTNSPLDTNK